MKILTLALVILSTTGEENAGDVIGDLANNCNPGKCVTGYYHKNGECKTPAKPDCNMGTLCSNNMCAPMLTTCAEGGNGCLGFMGGKCDLESPENVCGAGYRGKCYCFYSFLIDEAKIFSGLFLRGTALLYQGNNTWVLETSRPQKVELPQGGESVNSLLHCPRTLVPKVNRPLARGQIKPWNQQLPVPGDHTLILLHHLVRAIIKMREGHANQTLGGVTPQLEIILRAQITNLQPASSSQSPVIIYLRVPIISQTHRARVRRTKELHH
jgi:hypothetical protein